jgi:hypothetical protein
MLSNVQDPLSNQVLFPTTPQHSVEPPWGTVAIASARVGLPVGSWDPAPADGIPYIQNGCRYGFTSDEISSGVRGAWCASLDNLFYAGVQANLYVSKLQVDDYDLDEDILQGTPLVWNSSTSSYQAGAIGDSGLSYLWNSILVQNQNSYIRRNDWLDRFNGQSDPRVGQAMQNIVNRQGAAFDFSSGNLNQVVEH